MAEFGLLRDALVVVVTAFVGGALARLLRQPVLVGYLLGGVLVGPAGLHLLDGPESVSAVAEIGVGLLLFALGVEFSMADLGRAGPVAVGTGALQILGTFALGMTLGLVFGWEPAAAACLGAAVALSSTAVAIKLLGDRGDLDSPHGRIVIGLMLVQDLAAVPALVVLPTLNTPSEDLMLTVGLALAKTAAFLAVGVLFGMRAAPWLLARAAAMGSRELFLLAVISMLGATMLAAEMAGLSLAFGAFLAGLLISESDHAQQALADVLPLRDTLAGFFFVSLGMLADPAAALGAPLLLLLLLLVQAAKSLLTMGAVALWRYPPVTALLAGAAVGQMGEFSFLVAQAGVTSGTLPSDVYAVLLVAALVSMVLTPASLSGAERLVAYIRTQKPQSWLAQGQVGAAETAEEAHPALVNHAVICGYGRVGRHLVPVLRRRGLPVIVVDLDPQALAELRRDGVPCLYGDAATRPVLERCGLERARVMVVTMGDRAATELAVRQARTVNPRLDVVTRAPSHGDWSKLRELGAEEVVQPEFEAAMEILRHTLHRFGVSATEIGYIIAQLRTNAG